MSDIQTVPGMSAGIARATAIARIRKGKQVASYAIKMVHGYFACQGDTYWFENEPKGWALFCSEEDARDMAETHHSAIGTKPEEGYTLEKVDTTQTTPTPYTPDIRPDLDHHAGMSYAKHCGPNAIQCAEDDLLGQALEILSETKRWLAMDGVRHTVGDRAYSDFFSKTQSILSRIPQQ